MELDNIYKYLGLAIIILVVVYVVMKSLTFQARLIEGMKEKDKEDAPTTTDKDKVPDAIKSHTNTILDGLLIDKYRSSYDDTIIDLEENINATLLSGVIKYAEIVASDPSSGNSQKFMTFCNLLKEFKGTLNDTMKYLDGMKSSGAGAGANAGTGKSGKWF